MSLKKAVILIILVGIVFFAQLLGWLAPLENTAVRLLSSSARPIYSAAVGIKNWWTAFRQPTELSKHNEKLAAENSRLRVELNSLLAQAAENSRLRTMLDFRQTASAKPVTASVFARLDHGGAFSLAIDKGTKAGIAAGDLAVDEQGQLVGEILSVHDSFSTVRLMTHPLFSLGVKKAGGLEPIGILKGDFSTAATIELIPRDIELEPGGEVVTGNLAGRRADLRIGLISRVEDEPGSLFRTAVVEPFFDLNKIVFVQIFSGLSYD